MYCANCGNNMSNDQAFCGSCGSASGKGAKFCKSCGSPISDSAAVCVNCGSPTQETTSYNAPPAPGAVPPVYNTAPGSVPPGYVPPGYEQKSKLAAGLLGVFLGSLGIHNFYLGFTTKAIIQVVLTVVTCGFGATISGIWGLIEGILILTGSAPYDAKGVPLKE